MHDPQIECDIEQPLPGSAYLDRLSTGWRPLADARPGEFGTVDEVDNARIIYDTFREAGYSAALAFAGIVTAWSESSLDHTAIMDDPFFYNGKPYPNGSGAIGLFQLLPSSSGAGGPSGIAQGYGRDFQGLRYAGTPEQAERWGDEPDARGRTYYDATDPRTNTLRILLEIERDGARLLAADERGASIAVLTDVFGRDIERPAISTRYRRALAAEMLGADLAWAKNPNDLFADEPDPFDLLHLPESPVELPPPAVADAGEEHTRHRSPLRPLAMLVLGFLVLPRTL